MFVSNGVDEFVMKGKINGKWNEKQNEKQIKMMLRCTWILVYWALVLGYLLHTCWTITNWSSSDTCLRTFGWINVQADPNMFILIELIKHMYNYLVISWLFE
jgi:hypothetical protein